MTPKAAKIGARVWYTPSGYTAYSAIVDSEPWRLGSQWVVHLCCLPTAYAHDTGRPHTVSTVKAAALSRCDIRRTI